VQCFLFPLLCPLSDSDKKAVVSNSKYTLNLKALLTPKFYDALEKDEIILTAQNRRKLVDILADDIRDTVK